MPSSLNSETTAIGVESMSTFVGGVIRFAVMNMACVFDQLTARRLNLHHVTRVLAPDLQRLVASSKVSWEKLRVVSSANKTVEIPFRNAGRSLMKIRNRMGPKMEP